MGEEKNVILVVDDDLAVRESLKFALELEGLHVRACASGEELLRHPDLSKARCLLLDYKMPAMDGFEVLDRLRRLDVRIPVILTTSHVSSSISFRARLSGVRHILEKPFLDSALLDTINAVLHEAK